MSRRIEIYDALKSSPELAAYVGDRIVSASALNNVPRRPFIIVRMHNAFSVGGKIGKIDLAQVWCHDEPGDYMVVDEMMRLSKLAIEAVPLVGDLVGWSWVEDSVDLKDDDMHTVTRNARYQGTSTTRERH